MAGFTTADIASANAANALEENKRLLQRIASLEARVAFLDQKITALDRALSDLIADDTDARDRED